MNPTTPCRIPPKIRSSVTFSAAIADELQRFDTHLRDVQGLAPGTRKTRLSFVGLFLQDQFDGNAIEIGRLGPDDIRRFLPASLTPESGLHIMPPAFRQACIPTSATGGCAEIQPAIWWQPPKTPSIGRMTL